MAMTAPSANDRADASAKCSGVGKPARQSQPIPALFLCADCGFFFDLKEAPQPGVTVVAPWHRAVR
jgi:hypothetical protein